MKKAIILILVFFTVAISSCKKDDEIQIKKEKVSGFVQKGPFINGTSILMTELNTALEQTGKIFSTQITNNRGSFEINNVSLTSSFVEFSASGFYFDEVRGIISGANLNLYALSDITDINTVNVNILTHLEKRRVEYLVKQKNSFAEAKKTAQEEILAIFGFENNEMQESETLDISVNHADNAVLLAISLILQGKRSVGDLTELLAGISTDIAEDGILDTKSTITDLRNSTLTLNLQNIRQNLIARYQELGVAATIPNFEKYIADFLALTATEPIPVSLPATNITTSGATLNGTVNPNSSSTVVTFEYGLTAEYGSSITADQSPVSGSINTNVSADLSGLSPGTTYHFRVKAENELGTIYGEDNKFRTSYDGFTGTVTDVDGNIYSTIGIGSQLWMAENLKTTKYSNGTDIPLITDNTTWAELTTPGYCWYDNDQATYGETYGALYNWFTVEAGNLCPTGWHVPTDEEWKTLEMYLGMSQEEAELQGWRGTDEGGKLKETGTTHWNSPNTGATNESGFTALPGGLRYYGGSFHAIGNDGLWWSASEDGTGSAGFRNVYYDDSGVNRGYGDDEENGFSVRCLRDQVHTEGD